MSINSNSIKMTCRDKSKKIIDDMTQKVIPTRKIEDIKCNKTTNSLDNKMKNISQLHSTSSIEGIPSNEEIKCSTPLEGVAIATGSFAEFVKNYQRSVDVEIDGAQDSFLKQSVSHSTDKSSSNFEDNEIPSRTLVNGNGLDVTSIEAVGNFDDFMSKRKVQDSAIPKHSPSKISKKDESLEINEDLDRSFMDKKLVSCSKCAPFATGEARKRNIMSFQELNDHMKIFHSRSKTVMPLKCAHCCYETRDQNQMINHAKLVHRNLHHLVEGSKTKVERHEKSSRRETAHRRNYKEAFVSYLENKSSSDKRLEEKRKEKDRSRTKTSVMLPRRGSKNIERYLATIKHNNNNRKNKGRGNGNTGKKNWSYGKMANKSDKASSWLQKSAKPYVSKHNDKKSPAVKSTIPATLTSPRNYLTKEKSNWEIPWNIIPSDQCTEKHPSHICGSACYSEELLRMFNEEGREQTENANNVDDQPKNSSLSKSVENDQECGSDEIGGHESQINKVLFGNDPNDFGHYFQNAAHPSPISTSTSSKATTSSLKCTTDPPQEQQSKLSSTSSRGKGETYLDDQVLDENSSLLGHERVAHKALTSGSKLLTSFDHFGELNSSPYDSPHINEQSLCTNRNVSKSIELRNVHKNTSVLSQCENFSDKNMILSPQAQASRGEEENAVKEIFGLNKSYFGASSKMGNAMSCNNPHVLDQQNYEQDNIRSNESGQYATNVLPDMNDTTKQSVDDADLFDGRESTLGTTGQDLNLNFQFKIKTITGFLAPADSYKEEPNKPSGNLPVVNPSDTSKTPKYAIAKESFIQNQLYSKKDDEVDELFQNSNTDVVIDGCLPLSRPIPDQMEREAFSLSSLEWEKSNQFSCNIDGKTDRVNVITPIHANNSSSQMKSFDSYNYSDQGMNCDLRLSKSEATMKTSSQIFSPIRTTSIEMNKIAMFTETDSNTSSTSNSTNQKVTKPRKWYPQILKTKERKWYDLMVRKDDRYLCKNDSLYNIRKEKKMRDYMLKMRQNVFDQNKDTKKSSMILSSEKVGAKILEKQMCDLKELDDSHLFKNKCDNYAQSLGVMRKKRSPINVYLRTDTKQKLRERAANKEETKETKLDTATGQNFDGLKYHYDEHLDLKVKGNKDDNEDLEKVICEESFTKSIIMDIILSVISSIEECQTEVAYQEPNNSSNILDVDQTEKTECKENVLMCFPTGNENNTSQTPIKFNWPGNQEFSEEFTEMQSVRSLNQMQNLQNNLNGDSYINDNSFDYYDDMNSIEKAPNGPDYTNSLFKSGPMNSNIDMQPTVHSLHANELSISTTVIDSKENLFKFNDSEIIAHLQLLDGSCTPRSFVEDGSIDPFSNILSDQSFGCLDDSPLSFETDAMSSMIDESGNLYKIEEDKRYERSEEKTSLGTSHSLQIHQTDSYKCQNPENFDRVNLEMHGAMEYSQNALVEDLSNLPSNDRSDNSIRQSIETHSNVNQALGSKEVNSNLYTQPPIETNTFPVALFSLPLTDDSPATENWFQENECEIAAAELISEYNKLSNSTKNSCSNSPNILLSLQNAAQENSDSMLSGYSLNSLKSSDNPIVTEGDITKNKNSSNTLITTSPTIPFNSEIPEKADPTSPPDSLSYQFDLKKSFDSGSEFPAKKSSMKDLVENDGEVLRTNELMRKDQDLSLLSANKTVKQTTGKILSSNHGQYDNPLQISQPITNSPLPPFTCDSTSVNYGEPSKVVSENENVEIVQTGRNKTEFSKPGGKILSMMAAAERPNKESVGVKVKLKVKMKPEAKHAFKKAEPRPNLSLTGSQIIGENGSGNTSDHLKDSSRENTFMKSTTFGENRSLKPQITTKTKYQYPIVASVTKPASYNKSISLPHLPRFEDKKETNSFATESNSALTKNFQNNQYQKTGLQNNMIDHTKRSNNIHTRGSNERYPTLDIHAVPVNENNFNNNMSRGKNIFDMSKHKEYESSTVSDIKPKEKEDTNFDEDDMFVLSDDDEAIQSGSTKSTSGDIKEGRSIDFNISKNSITNPHAPSQHKQIALQHNTNDNTQNMKPHSAQRGGMPVMPIASKKMVKITSKLWSQDSINDSQITKPFEMSNTKVREGIQPLSHVPANRNHQTKSGDITKANPMIPLEKAISHFPDKRVGLGSRSSQLIVASKPDTSLMKKDEIQKESTKHIDSSLGSLERKTDLMCPQKRCPLPPDHLVQEAKYRWIIPKKVSVQVSNAVGMFPDKNSFTQLLEAAQVSKEGEKQSDGKKTVAMFSCSHCSFQSSCQFGLNQHRKLCQGNSTIGRNKSKNRYKDKEVSVDPDPNFIGFDDSYVPKYVSPDSVNRKPFFSSTKDIGSLANKKNGYLRGSSRSPSPTKVIHKGSKSQSCPHCSYSTLSSHNLSRHIKEDHGSISSKAEKLPWHVPLSVHQVTSKDNSVRIESKRNAEHSRPNDNTRMPNYSSKDTNNSKNISTTATHINPIFSCPYNDCGYRDRDEELLNNHIKNIHDVSITTGQKESCSLCNQQFRNKSDLQRHSQKVHKKDNQKEKRYICHLCEYETFYINHLEMHIHWIHEKKNDIFACTMCEFQCKENVQLREHIKDVHEAVTREHKCQHCPYECFSENDLNSHLISAHSDRSDTKTFECMYCDYTSKIQFSLNNHIKKNHAHKNSFTNVRPEPIYNNQKIPSTHLPYATKSAEQYNRQRTQHVKHSYR